MDTVRIDRVSQFIARFRSLREAQRRSKLKAMQYFLRDFERDHERFRSHREPSFNVFSLCRIDTDEVKQSSVLAWFLDARESHGQGNTFLKAFVDACGLDISTEAIGKYRVQTEFPWQESRIDIMVYQTGAFLIYLENKVLAEEGPEQIDREYRDMCRVGTTLSVPLEQQFAVFLTPDGKRPTSGDATHWHAVSYGNIGQAFARLLPGLEPSKLRFVLEDWIENAATLGGAK